MRAGVWTAWICFGLGVLGILSNPWNPLLAIPWAFAALGLSKGEAWSGYGPLLWLGSLLAWIAYRLTVDPAASQLRLESAAALVPHLVVACLMFRAGRGAEVASGRRLGSPWGWVALSCVTLAFLVLLRPMQIPTGAMEKTLLIGDHIPGRFLSSASWEYRETAFASPARNYS